MNDIMEEDLEQMFKDFSLTEEELDAVNILSTTTATTMEECRRSLLGALICEKHFNRTGLKESLQKMWNLKNEVRFIELTENVFQIIFQSQSSLRYVIENGPWG